MHQPHARRQHLPAMPGGDGHGQHMAFAAFARAQAAIGSFQRRRVEKFREGMVQSGQMVCGQKICRRTIVKGDLVMAGHQQDAKRHLCCEGREFFLFLDQPGGFLCDSLGQLVTRRREVFGDRLSRRGKIAKITGAVFVQRVVHIRMGARQHAAGQPLDRLGNVFVEHQPDPDSDGQNREAGDGPGKNEAIGGFGKAKTGIAQIQPARDGNNGDHGQQDEEQKDTQAQGPLFNLHCGPLRSGL